MAKIPSQDEPEINDKPDLDKVVAKLAIASSINEYYKNREVKNKWGFQLDALEAIDKYQKHFKSGTSKSKLIKMPTGTGKSAVMALASNYIFADKRVLIVVPSIALKDQLEKYLTWKHWLTTGRQPRNIKKTGTFTPGTIDELQSTIPGNFICAAKTMSDLYQEEGQYGWQNLKKIVDVIFVDEGHQEPAKIWSKAVRELEKKTILFSATPYRNDRRFFRLDDEFYELTYQEALNKFACIREISFHPSTKEEIGQYERLEKTALEKNKAEKNKSSLSDARTTTFLESFLNFFIAKAKTSGLVSPKAIIHCRTAGDVMRVFERLSEIIKKRTNEFEKIPQLKKRSANVVAIHETFTPKGLKGVDEEKKGYFFADVSDCQEKFADATFWIHQYKLLEGIDDYQFFVVALHDPFGNARSLVQQVGRVIRKIGGIKNDNAYLFSAPNNHAQRIFWDGYCRYEEIPHDEKIIGTEQIVEKIMSAFPDYFYFDRKFSQLARSTHKEWEKTTDEKIAELKKVAEGDLRIPQIANIFEINGKIKEPAEFVKSLMSNFSENLSDQDVIVLQQGTWPVNGVHVGVLLGWKIKPSELLQDSIFFDINFTAYSVVLTGEYLFYRGDLSLQNHVDNIPQNADKGKDTEPIGIELIDPLKLEWLAAPAKKKPLIIKQAAIINTDSSDHSTRRRVEGGKDLTQTAPFLNDHLHIVTSLVSVINSRQRYIGITRSRLTDDHGTYISLDHYLDWIGKIVARLKKYKAGRREYFSRWAVPITIQSSNFEIDHILIDLTGFSDLYQHPTSTDGAPIAFEEGFVEVNVLKEQIEKRNDNTWTFPAKLQEEIFMMELTYQKRKFHLRPSKDDVAKFNEQFSTDNLRVNTAKPKSGNVNFRQQIIFKLITNKGWFYVDGHFFNPKIALWGTDRIQKLDLIYGCEALVHVDCEKPKTRDKWCVKDTWPEDSIFYLVDTLRHRGAGVKFTHSNGKKGVTFEKKQQGNDRTVFYPDYLICDDMAGELADFIAFNDTKIVFIHCKQSEVKGSASSIRFEDVATQVVKNLRCFDPYNFSEKEVITDWKKPWSELGKKMERVRKKRKSTEDTKDLMAEMIQRIKSGLEREVWIVYGGGFKAQEFYAEIADPAPKFHYRHLIYSILNCDEAVSRHGAKLRIFTQP